ncbi:protein phosphatase inhibitor, putative [Pediculus humanus corporis]|uniref:Protein phosphatase inhibitor, putative n=1 Tax=Pediculus humanus subsp. corporis TaxID=121224 RepID=E0VRE1_PEDHC|nr:protein phosphatase inhibitor, putative [Pediculus humanus corporis]EEB15948.1 protein phosphatase inhibitor, putative [Pediculus humanus corporis]
MANGGDIIQIMADNPQKRPSKGILKTSTSFEKQGKNSKKNKPKETKWDEMNIIATLHPSEKDYGHMKIEEPKTPYNYDFDDEDEVDAKERMLDPEELAEKLKNKLDRTSKVDEFDEGSSDSESELSAEELARKNVFKSKRKMHYNEFKVVEFARKLIKADEEALENDEEGHDRNACPTSSGKLIKIGY